MKINMRKYLKGISVIMMSLLVIQLFTPGVFATYNNRESYSGDIVEEKELGFLSSTPITNAEGEQIVEVLSLDWTEIQDLIRRTSEVTFDGFGNKDTYEMYKAMERGELSAPGATNASNQFMISNSGEPVLLYDLLEQRIVNPNEVGYLSHMVTQGFVSYTTSVDKTIRVCPEYPDEDCEAGHLNPSEVAELEAKLNDLQFKIEAEVNRAKGVAEKIGEETLRTIGISEHLNFSEEDVSEIEQIKERLEDRSPLNTIQSDYSITHLTHASSVLMFPYHLSQYIGFLDSLRTQEQFYAIAKIGAVAVGLSSAANSIAAKRLASQGIDGITGKSKLGAGTLPQTKKGLANMADFDPKLLDADGTVDMAKIESLKSQAKQFGYVWDDGESAFRHSKTGIGIHSPQKVAENLQAIQKNAPLEIVSDIKKSGGDVDVLTDTLRNKKVAEQTTGNLYMQTDEFIEVKRSNPQLASRVQELLEGHEGAWKMARDGEGGYDLAAGMLRQQEIGTEALVKGIAIDVDPNDLIMQTGRHMGIQGLGKIANTEGAISLATDSSRTLQALRLAKGGASMFWNGVQIQRGFLGIVFLVRSFGSQPTATLELSTLSIEAKPQGIVKQSGEPSYFEIARATEDTYGKDIYPANIFSNTMSFFGFEWILDTVLDEADQNIIRDKIERNPGPGYVMVMDQQSAAEAYSATPVNMILPQTVDGQTKWMITNRNPSTTNYHTFEHPRSYVGDMDSKYSTIVLRIKNLDISGMSTVETDWATDDLDWLLAMTPTTWEMIQASAIVGAAGAIGGLPSGIKGSMAVRTTLSAVLVRGLGGLTEDQAERVQSQRYGSIVDVGEAYRSDQKLCSEVLKESEEEVKTWRNRMYITLTIDAVGSALTFMGPLAPVGTAMSIGGSITNYWTTREYDRAKTEGLNDMKNCLETQFDVLAYSKMDQETQASRNIIESITGALGKGLSQIPGIDSVTPEARQGIQEIGETAYLNTMSLNGIIEGDSLTNLYGTELYQIHFDREAEVKWFLKEYQNIEFCTIVGTTPLGDPEFQCMRKQGYQLFDAHGNQILSAPHVRGFRWDNADQLMTIPQEVINIKISSEQDPMIDVVNERVQIKEEAVNTAVRDLTKSAYTDEALGELQMITTRNAVIWQEGSTTVVKMTGPILGNIGEGQILRYDNSRVRVYRNNELEIVSNADDERLLDYAFELGRDGFLSFTNAKLVPGRGEQEVTIDGEVETRNFDEWNHLMIYELLSFSSDNVQRYTLSDELLELCLDELGQVTGLNLQGDFGFDESGRANELLMEMCLSYIEGSHNQSISIEDNQICYKDPQGNVVCREIIGFEDGQIIMEGGYSLGVEVGPDGQPQFHFYRDGEPYGSPIPLLRGTGLGGTINFNPETGRISISNEFPFQINPEFGRIGMGMDNPGMVVPQQSPWGSRPMAPGVDVGPRPQPSPLAQLPSVPTEPILLAAFIVTILGGVLAIRKKDSLKKEQFSQ